MKHHMSIPKRPLRYWLLLSTISSLLIVSRVAFSFIPNFKPLTATFLIVAVCFDFSSSLLLMSITLFASNLIFGMGPWFFQQWFGFFLAILWGYYLIRLPQSRFYTLIYNGFILALSGVIFGVGTSVWYAAITSLSFQATIAYWLRGIPFDASHALGNAIFWYLLSPFLIKKLQHFDFLDKKIP